MFNLTQQEKQIIIFLCLAVLVGLGVNYYRKTSSRVASNIAPSKISTETTLGCLQDQVQKVNINNAEIEQLMSLPQIGPVLAKRIIEYRKQNGPFTKIEDIQKVKGIGLKKFNEIKEFLSVE